MSVDPLRDKYADLSSYQYVAGNPVMRFDPDGRKISLAGAKKTMVSAKNKVVSKAKGAFRAVKKAFSRRPSGDHQGIRHEYADMDVDEPEPVQYYSEEMEVDEPMPHAQIANNGQGNYSSSGFRQAFEQAGHYENANIARAPQHGYDTPILQGIYDNTRFIAIQNARVNPAPGGYEKAALRDYDEPELKQQGIYNDPELMPKESVRDAAALAPKGGIYDEPILIDK
jgi:hypothetical protein